MFCRYPSLLSLTLVPFIHSLNIPQDLPRSAIAMWCDFFVTLSPEAKTEVMRRMWDVLSSEEKSAVIIDLRQFISLAVQLESDTKIASCREMKPLS